MRKSQVGQPNNFVIKSQNKGKTNRYPEFGYNRSVDMGIVPNYHSERIIKKGSTQ